MKLAFLFLDGDIIFQQILQENIYKTGHIFPYHINSWLIELFTIMTRWRTNKSETLSKRCVQSLEDKNTDVLFPILLPGFYIYIKFLFTVVNW